TLNPLWPPSGNISMTAKRVSLSSSMTLHKDTGVEMCQPSRATNKVPAVVLSGTWQVAGVVIGFLLHSDRSRVMENKLTNTGPLRAPADKHSIYPCNARHRISVVLLTQKRVSIQWRSTVRYGYPRRVSAMQVPQV